MYELDLSQEPRNGTGRGVLKVIASGTRAPIEAAIKKHIVREARVWTDGHRCYSWLGQGAEDGRLARSGYRHSQVAHKSRELAREGPGGWVSTDAVEQLLSRVKRFLRIMGSEKVGRSQYGPLLGEFLWREAFLRSGRWARKSGGTLPLRATGTSKRPASQG